MKGTIVIYKPVIDRNKVIEVAMPVCEGLRCSQSGRPDGTFIHNGIVPASRMKL